MEAIFVGCGAGGPQLKRNPLGGALTIESILDPDLGTLTWDPALEWWQGSIFLSSPEPFRLYLLARAIYTPARAITKEARLSVARLRGMESACRQYATNHLLGIYNSEWSPTGPLLPAAFSSLLRPDCIEVHETGYAEFHFADGGLFQGHGIGVRIRPDGSFQEALIEG